MLSGTMRFTLLELVHLASTSPTTILALAAARLAEAPAVGLAREELLARLLEHETPGRPVPHESRTAVVHVRLPLDVIAAVVFVIADGRLRWFGRRRDGCDVPGDEAEVVVVAASPINPSKPWLVAQRQIHWRLSEHACRERLRSTACPIEADRILGVSEALL